MPALATCTSLNAAVLPYFCAAPATISQICVHAWKEMADQVYLFEEEEVNTHGRVEQQGWQEDIEEELIRLYTQPPGNGIAQSTQTAIRWEHERLEYPT